MINNVGSARGGGRLCGRGRSFPPQRFINRGPIPNISAYLNFNDKGMPANDTEFWMESMKIYCLSHMETSIDDIFKANGAAGEYPTVLFPELPVDEDDRCQFKIWDIAYNMKTKVDRRLSIEKLQLFRWLLGQMSSISRD